MFSRAIGRYASGSLYDFLPGFRITIIQACLNYIG
jgi:hypothetical protein